MTVARHGSASARTIRSVVSGMCASAARLGLLEHNPVRDVTSLSSKPKRPPRALTVDQVHDLRRTLRDDRLAVRRDIPEFVDFLLATGLRVCEASAVRWQDLKLDNATLAVHGNAVRVKRLGLVLQESDSSKLTLRILTFRHGLFRG